MAVQKSVVKNTEQNSTINASDKFKSMCKEMVVVCHKLLAHNFPCGLQKDTEPVSQNIRPPGPDSKPWFLYTKQQR